MGSVSAVVLTAILHLLMRVSIFYEQPKNQCSPAPEIGSWLFVISIFLLLLDNEIFPYKYRSIPSICQIFGETFISLVITEFSMLVLWCNMEKGAFSFVKYALSESNSNMYLDMGGDKLVGFIITIFAVFILSNVAIATGFYDEIQNKYKTWKQGVAKKVSSIWKTRPTVRECEMAMDAGPRCVCEEEGSPVRRRRRSKNCY